MDSRLTEVLVSQRSAGDEREFILVDAEQNTQAPAFDHEKLAEAISKAAGKKYEPTKLPFDDIEFSDD